jgi:hypothetical protein
MFHEVIESEERYETLFFVKDISSLALEIVIGGGDRTKLKLKLKFFSNNFIAVSTSQWW